MIAKLYNLSKKEIMGHDFECMIPPHVGEYLSFVFSRECVFYQIRAVQHCINEFGSYDRIDLLVQPVSQDEFMTRNNPIYQ